MNGAVRCPRFDSCNAPICPLDPKWPVAQHIQGERVCGLMTEVVKVGGQQRVESVLSPDQFATFVREWSKVEARWTDIRARLRASAKTGSRIDRARANFHTPSSGTQAVPLPTPLVTRASPVVGAFSGGAE